MLSKFTVRSPVAPFGWTVQVPWAMMPTLPSYLPSYEPAANDSGGCSPCDMRKQSQ